MFKQIKQNFPLHFFYGESASAIKIQIWVTLIANLLLTIMQRSLHRRCSFSNLATTVRITLMYYVDFLSFFSKTLKKTGRKCCWKPQSRLRNWSWILGRGLELSLEIAHTGLQRVGYENLIFLFSGQH